MRVAGYAVTLAGVVLVGYGILQTQQMFGRPRYGTRILAWLKRFPAIFRSRKIVGAISTGGIGLSGSASATVRAGAKDGSISARLRALEENVRRIDERITGVEQHTRSELQQLRESIASEQREREQRDALLGQRLEDYSAGSLDLELVGVAWVIFGQAFGSFPAEIASWFG